MSAGGARKQKALAKLSLGTAFYTTFGTIGYMTDILLVRKNLLVQIKRLKENRLSTWKFKT